MPSEIQHPSRIPKDFVIFYCWQDHLEQRHHRYLIRTALTNAINRVQAEIPDNVECTLRLDSDTSDKAGAVDIANTILSKIASSAMLVGDVTPCLWDDANRRFYPNPNVMFEVGYGAKALGWSRILCVFNAGRTGSEAKLRAEDVPFDIRHRRLSSYVCRADSGISQATKELEAELVAGIRAVIQEIDRGEFDPSLGNGVLKRSKDLRLLTTLLNQIHRNSLDRYIESASRDCLHDDCDFFWYGFDAVVCSSHFRFYDKKLEDLIGELWALWRQATGLSGYVFGPSGLPGQFTLKANHLWNEPYETAVNKWRQSARDLSGVFNAFLDHVHEHYPEIDLDETDRTAWHANLPYIRGDHFRADDSGPTPS
jgi:hypothetical protein